jgi:hypothetical protein
MTNPRKISAALVLLALAGIAFAQTDAAGKDFAFELGIGTASLPTDPTKAVDPATNPLVTFQKLALKPEINFGKFGLGFDLTVHFNLKLGTGQEGVEFYQPDWIPSAAGKNIFELYLPKIAFARWGVKGDPIYAKLGSFEDGTLGNGFIMGNYANTRFLPESRIFGLAFDLDGALFNFPYIGFEGFIGNLARADVLGGRLFVRPLIGTELPIFKNLQIGATLVVDREPYLYDSNPGNDSDGSVAVAGGDFRLPILGTPVVSMAAFGDFVVENGGRWGSMVGVGGKLVSFFTYGAQLRVLGPGFIPTYFDAAYDLFRHLKYQAVSADPTGSVFAGWMASLGTTLLDNKIVFNVSMDGPFSAAPATGATIGDFPHLRGVFTVADGILAGFSFDALYEKFYLGADQSYGGTGNFLKDLISPEKAIIGAKINYKTGPAILSLLYNLRFDPATGDFIVTSSLMSSIRF